MLRGPKLLARLTTMIHDLPIDLVHHPLKCCVRQFGRKYIKYEAGVAFSNLVAYTEDWWCLLPGPAPRMISRVPRFPRYVNTYMSGVLGPDVVCVLADTYCKRRVCMRLQKSWEPGTQSQSVTHILRNTY